MRERNRHVKAAGNGVGTSERSVELRVIGQREAITHSEVCPRLSHTWAVRHTDVNCGVVWSRTRSRHDMFDRLNFSQHTAQPLVVD